MTKQEIIDKYWLEFIEFYREISKAAKKEEVDQLGTDKFGANGSFEDLMKMTDLLKDKEKFKVLAAYLEFKDPTETAFWKWWALVRKAK